MSSEKWQYIRKHGQPLRTASGQYHKRRDRRQRQLLQDASLPVTVESIADSDNLMHAFQALQQSGGEGAGVDGIRLPDVTTIEMGNLLKECSEQILSGIYRPQPTKAIAIPKDQPGQVRMLSIPTLMDRVVARALTDALTPIWENILTDSVWAYRPARSPSQMLATLLKAMERTGRTVLVIDDITQAFDRVPITKLMDIHRKMIQGLPSNPRSKQPPRVRKASEASLLKFIRKVLVGSPPDRQRGIPQGGNYSPMALNALLHYTLDVPMIAKSKDTLWYRYSDNLLYLAKSVPEGTGKLAEIRSHLGPLGMTLKGSPEDGVLDLAAGSDAHLLGFSLRRHNQQTVLGLHPKAQNWLRDNFREAYSTDDPPEVACNLLAGWIRSYGPAFASGGPPVREILDLAAQEGFREVASSKTVQLWIDDARTDWQQTRKRAG